MLSPVIEDIMQYRTEKKKNKASISQLSALSCCRRYWIEISPLKYILKIFMTLSGLLTQCEEDVLYTSYKH